MIKLVINQPGFYLELPGITPFRTPGSVNITHRQIAPIITELQKLGVSDFDIDIGTKKRYYNAPAPPAPGPHNTLGVDTSSRLDTIEQMLEILLERKPEVIQQILSNRDVVFEEVADEDSFVPDIDTGGMSMEGESSVETVESEIDTSGVDSLKNLTKGIKNKYSK